MKKVMIDLKKAKVYAENYETGERRYLDTVTYNGTGHNAIEMYEDECDPQCEEIVLVDIE